jgi:hypothetical protein
LEGETRTARRVASFKDDCRLAKGCFHESAIGHSFGERQSENVNLILDLPFDVGRFECGVADACDWQHV